MFDDPSPTTVSTSSEDLVSRETVEGGTPIALFRCHSADIDPMNWARTNKEHLLVELREYGAVLFRGFGVDSIAGLREFAMVFTPQLVPYLERRSPRTELGQNIYTSTIHPADQYIHFHNTTSFSHQWPLKLWFSCIHPAEWEGRTPISDIRVVLNRMDPKIRQKFEDLGVMYVSNYYEGMGLSWQTTFQTEDRPEVEAYCRGHGIDYEWIGGDRLRTKQVRHAVAIHPATGERAWFNQAHHFHVTSLEPEVTKTLLATYRDEDLPRNSYYGDGSPIEQETLEHIAECYEAAKTDFLWEKGDVIMLDNMLVAHARTPYRGERLIALALGEMYAGTYHGGGVALTGSLTDSQESPIEGGD
jgi:alpha-ketoglutarate-dependent taurine dioxygenase